MRIWKYRVVAEVFVSVEYPKSLSEQELRNLVRAKLIGESNSLPIQVRVISESSSGSD